MAEEHRVTEEILKKTLGNKHEAHPKDIKLKDFSLSAGSNKGDGYACEMKKVNVTSEIRDNIHKDIFMYKCVPMGEAMIRLMKEALIFRTETIFYTDLVSKLNQIARDHGLDEISTSKIYYGDEDDGVLAMEDLKEAGFALKGKDVGLSVPHMKLFLRELAKIHGLSYHFIETYFGGLERFKKDYWYMNCEGWFNQDCQKAVDVIDQMMKITFSLAIMVLEESPEHKHLLEPFKEFANERHWKTKNDPHAPKGPFNCLLHNDAWCNNVMFRDSSEGQAKGICLIDFQTVRRARPTVDLVYCLVSSMAPEVRKAHLDELLRYYHSELITILKKTGYSESVYPFEQLKADYADAYPHGFTMGLQHIMIQGTDPNAEGNFDFQKMMSDEGAEAIEELNAFLRVQARTNEKLRRKMLLLVQEARGLNIL